MKRKKQGLSELRSAQSGSCCHNKHATHDVSPMYIFPIKHNKASKQASFGAKTLCTIFPYGILFSCITCTSVYAGANTHEQAQHCAQAQNHPFHKVSISLSTQLHCIKKNLGC